MDGMTINHIVSIDHGSHEFPSDFCEPKGTKFLTNWGCEKFGGLSQEKCYNWRRWRCCISEIGLSEKQPGGSRKYPLKTSENHRFFKVETFNTFPWSDDLGVPPWLWKPQDCWKLTWGCWNLRYPIYGHFMSRFSVDSARPKWPSNRFGGFLGAVKGTMVVSCCIQAPLTWEPVGATIRVSPHDKLL